MHAGETVLLAAAQVPGNVVQARAQMAATLGFHIIPYGLPPLNQPADEVEA